MKKIFLINEYHYQYIYIYTTRYCYFCIDREASYRFSNRIFAFEFVFSQKRKKERKKKPGFVKFVSNKKWWSPVGMMRWKKTAAWAGRRLASGYLAFFNPFFAHPFKQWKVFRASNCPRPQFFKGLFRSLSTSKGPLPGLSGSYPSLELKRSEVKAFSGFELFAM